MSGLNTRIIRTLIRNLQVPDIRTDFKFKHIKLLTSVAIMHSEFLGSEFQSGISGLNTRIIRTLAWNLWVPGIRTDFELKHVKLLTSVTIVHSEFLGNRAHKY